MRLFTPLRSRFRSEGPGSADAVRELSRQYQYKASRMELLSPNDEGPPTPVATLRKSFPKSRKAWREQGQRYRCHRPPNATPGAQFSALECQVGNATWLNWHPQYMGCQLADLPVPMTPSVPERRAWQRRIAPQVSSAPPGPCHPSGRQRVRRAPVDSPAPAASHRSHRPRWPQQAD